MNNLVGGANEKLHFLRCHSRFFIRVHSWLIFRFFDCCGDLLVAVMPRQRICGHCRFHSWFMPGRIRINPGAVKNRI